MTDGAGNSMINMLDSVKDKYTFDFHKDPNSGSNPSREVDTRGKSIDCKWVVVVCRTKLAEV